MARPLTYRRHGRHSRYDRVERRTNNQLVPGLGQDTQRFVDDQQTRLDTAEGSEGVFDSMMLVQGEDESFTFDQVREATDPTALGLTSSFPVQTQSIDFDGVTESLGNLTGQVMGIANAWSIGVWAKADGMPSSESFFSIRPAAGLANRIQILKDTLSLRVIWADSSGAPDQTSTWNNEFTVGNWFHFFVYWNGTILQPFINGVNIGAPDVGVNNPSITMTDTARRINIGDLVGGTGFEWAGNIAQAAMWRVAKQTQPEVDALFNAGNPNALDLNSAFTDYSDAANLAHWWRCGHEASPNIGKDFATAGFTPTIDIEVPDSVDITDADRVADVPT